MDRKTRASSHVAWLLVLLTLTTGGCVTRPVDEAPDLFCSDLHQRIDAERQENDGAVSFHVTEVEEGSWLYAELSYAVFFSARAPIRGDLSDVGEGARPVSLSAAGAAVSPGDTITYHGADKANEFEIRNRANGTFVGGSEYLCL